jgi:hypothetical protein
MAAPDYLPTTPASITFVSMALWCFVLLIWDGVATFLVSLVLRGRLPGLVETTFRAIAAGGLVAVAVAGALLYYARVVHEPPATPALVAVAVAGVLVGAWAGRLLARTRSVAPWLALVVSGLSLVPPGVAFVLYAKP